MSKEPHGTIVARLCFELDAPTVQKNRDGSEYISKHSTIGLLIYYRTGEAQIRLDSIPISAFRDGVEFFIGNFIESEKVPEPPYIEGDIVSPTDTRGEPVTCGYILSKQDESGRTQYAMRLYSIPVGQWKKAISQSDLNKKSLYLKVQD
jgi:hypothetical protein|tara:strand:- start:2397 stop:2843 length:447 start_codon:yes stop_codon:yes gene_type:complete